MVRILTTARLTAAGLLLAGAALAATPSAAAGDPAAGKVVFSHMCSTCHSATKGGPTILGPNLFGVVGRPVASVKGYDYSPAMKAYGGAWSADRLAGYLPAPAKAVPGTKMTFMGLKNPTQVADVIAYLSTLK